VEIRGGRFADLRVKDGVGVIELRHPPANAYTFEMMHELDEAVLTARFDENVRALVLCGAGERFFCAGPDLDLLRAVTPAFRDAFQLHAAETIDRLARTPKLVVAALDGHAISGGLELAMAADVRLARAGAGRVGLPMDGLGVWRGARWPAGLHEPGVAPGSTESHALLGFEEARALGLVDQVWTAASAGDFLERVLAFARSEAASEPPAKAAARRGPPARDGGEIPFEVALARERERLRQLLEV
jgi:enoyl-CoA hydratase